MIALPWSFDPWTVAPLALSAVLYGRGTWLLRERNPSLTTEKWIAFAFAGGWVLLAIALISPLQALGEHLFTAHMVQHEILMAFAAPLLSLSRPLDVMSLALPELWRERLVRSLGSAWIAGVWRWLTGPVNATILHGVAIWIWHAPLLFDAAIRDPAIHRLQHLFFFGTALLFWWSLFRRERANFGAGALKVAITMVHTSVLGALIALSPRLLYIVQTRDSAAFGLSPMDDQQLGGLIMWVPAGTIYAGIALALMAFWIRDASRKSSPSLAE